MNCLIVERGDPTNHAILNRLKIKFEDTPFSYKSKDDGIAIMTRQDEFICGHIHYIMDRNYLKITKWTFYSQLDSILCYVKFINKIVDTKKTYVLMFSETIWNNPYNQWLFKITNTWSENNSIEIDSLFDPFVNQIVDFVEKPEQATVGTQTDPEVSTETKSLAIQTTPAAVQTTSFTSTPSAFALPSKTETATSTFATPAKNTETKTPLFATPTTPTTPAFATPKTPTFPTPTTPAFATPAKKTDTKTLTDTTKTSSFSVPSFTTTSSSFNTKNLGSFTFGK